MSAIKKVVVVPENGQISIGKSFAGKTVQIETVEEGLLITPGTFIPDHLQTFYTDEAKEKLAAFNQHIENQESVKDADDILGEIDADRS